MTTNEKWLKFYKDFGANQKSSQGSIFWSSSESDLEDVSLKSPVKRRRNSSSDKSEISEDEISRGIEKSPSLNSSWNTDSPILSSNWKQDSPVLNSRMIHKSPVLINTYKKRRKEMESKVESLYCTPDLFNSQPSQFIEDDLPEASQKSCKVELVTQIQQTQSSVVIEPVFSQNASIVAEFGSTDSDKMTDSTNSSSFCIPRKRKKYKKDGLAEKVYHMMQSQSFKYTVWQIHKQNSNDDTCIKCSIKKTWKEYGTTILECTVIKNDSDASESIILICLSPIINITLDIGCICEFFTPFIEKTVLYHNREVTCYTNVIKIQPVAT
ncbi:unnamed protein product [Acanthoscelides obtectus]|uniref:Uncharacterized protein n=1 Tax=Acanthoscelides obtectus TaxID=200917 RepID=A0A9P0KA97_ACAOB|nr:unnamed protein product [Acanthoscelides obtectus]CAK1629363.1 hypothetical protein AOBTE_LOCUS5702 [Acanthoscelides obtectus]